MKLRIYHWITNIGNYKRIQFGSTFTILLRLTFLSKIVCTFFFPINKEEGIKLEVHDDKMKVKIVLKCLHMRVSHDHTIYLAYESKNIIAKILDNYNNKKFK